ncbi:L-serine ammonia-lyase [bacterium]|nr:L-serine ammonia-lyase [bacterium]
MSLSVFDLFSIGVGPSSSHTVGPMRASAHFANTLLMAHEPSSITRVMVELYGSLALTGIGHGTDKAVLLGLEGEYPETVGLDKLSKRPAAIKEGDSLKLVGRYAVPFHFKNDVIFRKADVLPMHANGLRFVAYGKNEKLLMESVYYSIGGGFVVDGEGNPIGGTTALVEKQEPYPFRTFAELREHCEKNDLYIHQVMMANERCWRGEDAIREKLNDIWDVMRHCVDTGIHGEGILPGGLNVRRRAPGIYQSLRGTTNPERVSGAMDWLSVYAMAVNEENAGGGRVVTAPTNGAAGVIPAVLYYYLHHSRTPRADAIQVYLLTTGAIGMLYKHGASLSAAEVGCQGEVGVASSMAAAGYAALIGGTLNQIENAAEIAMEHHLGMTCDPIMGLVQIPCIERNAMGAIKAVGSAKLALHEAGTNIVSLDRVIATMLQTGKDMMSKYKETSLGGLAVNVPEC